MEYLSETRPVIRRFLTALLSVRMLICMPSAYHSPDVLSMKIKHQDMRVMS